MQNLKAEILKADQIQIKELIVADHEEMQMLQTIGSNLMARAKDPLAHQMVSKVLQQQKHVVRKGNRKVIS